MTRSHFADPHARSGGVAATTTGSVRAAGRTDPGLSRTVNEDRFHVDDRGLLMVIDGLGGQAAGGKAADTALGLLRARLERPAPGALAERIREAITVANNEIKRLAGTRAEWQGMACVLTVAKVDGDRVVVGHVGDSRLYKLRPDGIEKITRDHSPVGEREDAGEMSEADAMRHPRRNEVYRDVGSERHHPNDPDFIDIYEVPLEADAALLACSDGLTDLVSLATIGEIVSRLAGDAREVAHALVEAANAAGGKDNVTVVYVEKDQFASALRRAEPGRTRPFRGLLAGVVLMVVAAAVVMMRASNSRPMPAAQGPLPAIVQPAGVVVVRPGGSIAGAIASASPGTDVLVEPGEYRERLVLRDGIRVISRVSRAATLRLPGTASEGEAAVVALGAMRAEISGFRIVGDAATPLGTGIVVRDAALSIINCEITGAARAAMDLAGKHAVVIGSDIRDNPGAALAIRAGGAPRVTHNAFSRNGLTSRAASSVVIEPGAHPDLSGNVFEGSAPLRTTDDELRGRIQRNNWFVSQRRADAPAATNGRDR
jgi:serine/threonine protein phosphatase PrpC